VLRRHARVHVVTVAAARTVSVGIPVPIRVAGIVATAARVFDARVDRAEIVVAAVDRRAGDAAELPVAHLGAVAVDAVVAGGRLGVMPAAVEVVIAPVGGAIDRIVTLGVLDAGLAELRVDRRLPPVSFPPDALAATSLEERVARLRAASARCDRDEAAREPAPWEAPRAERVHRTKGSSSVLALASS